MVWNMLNFLFHVLKLLDGKDISLLVTACPHTMFNCATGLCHCSEGMCRFFLFTGLKAPCSHLSVSSVVFSLLVLMHSVSH